MQPLAYFLRAQLAAPVVGEIDGHELRERRRGTINRTHHVLERLRLGFEAGNVEVGHRRCDRERYELLVEEALPLLLELPAILAHGCANIHALDLRNA